VLNTRHLELRPPVVLVLPHAADRPLVGIALALANGRRTRLRTLALHGQGEDLPVPLRMAMFGLDPRSEADRAIRHLVDSARRGAHVAVRVIRDDAAVATQVALLDELDPETPLVVGRVRGGAPLELDRLEPLVRAHRGPVIALDVPPSGPAPSDLLAVLPPRDAPGWAPAVAQTDALERSYATFRPDGIGRLSDLEVVAKDCTAEVLTLIGLPSTGALGPLSGLKGRLDSLFAGPVAVVIPPGPEAWRTVGRLFPR